MALGRSYGVAVAFLFLAGVFVASGSDKTPNQTTESQQDLGEAKEKIGSFFDTFDDVITGQAVRVSEGIAKKDDVINHELVSLVDEAENLEDEIYVEAKRLKDEVDEEDEDDDDDEEDDEDDEEDEKQHTDVMERMQADAASLVEDTSKVLKEAEKKLTANPNDAKLKEELTSLKDKASGVLDSLKDAEAKRKLRKSLRRKRRKMRKGKKNRKRKNKKNKKKNKKPTEKTPEIQSDSSTSSASQESPLWIEPLSGKPVSIGKKLGLGPDKRLLPLTAAKPSSLKMPTSAPDNSTDPGKSPSKPDSTSSSSPTTSKYMPVQPDNHHHHNHLPHDVPADYKPVMSHDMHKEMLEKFLKNKDGLARSNAQYYDTNGLSKYLENCKDCIESTTGYECPLNNEVLEMKKWAAEVQEVLSFGCQKPASCQEPGVCCIKDKYPFKQTVVQMTQMLKDIYNIFQDNCKNGCKEKYQRDPAWSPWSSWSSCDATCGRGLRERRRQCDNPSPKGNQPYCLGKPIEVESCDSKDCCVDGDWGSWDSWGTCSSTCGQGFRERSRSCDSPRPNSCGKSCDGSGRDIEECKNLPKCCVDGNWSPWNSWSTCSATCGSGIKERKRTCDDPKANYCGRSCSGSDREMDPCQSGKDCCIDGNWSSWTRWAPCSVTCGKGVSNRKRKCNNPVANYCGDRCYGNANEERECGNAQDCCRDGSWSSWSTWSSCSESCGSGLRSRIRRCDSPSPNFCGQRCPGSPYDTLACKEKDCCVDGNWGTWGSWEGCSSSCGRGNELRRRKCDSPPSNFCGESCPGAPVDLRTCDKGDCCVDGNWGSWGTWSSCTATCGDGNQVRARQCNNPPANSCGRRCPGRGSEYQNCSSGPCALRCRDGVWSSWSSWTSCSDSCGNGMRGRVRTCTEPSPDFCGIKCPGDGEEIEPCDKRLFSALGTDGVWGTWSSWSSCSASCGSGSKSRRRACARAGLCGRDCPGSGFETDSCNEASCAPRCIDGNWGSWMRWSDCSESCGEGVRTKRRICDSPRANYCGEECPGRDTLYERCNNADSRWSTWTSWSTCSVTCGTGLEMRSRVCLDPTPNTCKNEGCEGESTNSRRCDMASCRPRLFCVDGNWGSWTLWSSCSVSCGNGVRSRSRSCDNPRKNSCGNDCPGSGIQSDACNQQPCQTCVDGNWGSWTRWSSCSVSCGQGSRNRLRICDNPRKNSCGRDCPGSGRDDAVCNQGACQVCVDGNWGSWTRWSSCSVSCGQGTRNRLRACDNPSQNLCGRDCPGSGRDDEICNQGSCQVCVDGNWGSWTRWSSCSVSCGQGSRNRLRICDNPRKSSCGRDCPGSGRDDEVCNQRPCQTCVDGNWGSWQRWSSCSVSCGQGSRNRLRQCNNPSRNSCGRDCPGSDRDGEVCNQGPCQTCVDGNWGSWQRWSSCSVSCGQGSRSRQRQCNNPSRNSCGRDCPGSDRDGEVCNQGPCQSCVDGNWGSWQRWSTCSVSCGQGSRSRQRQCNNPSRNSCGRDCPGSDRDGEVCNQGSCQTCVDGNWGSWQRWSSCSASCGQGSRTRIRVCNNPSRNSCGRDCPGSGRDDAACNQGSCQSCRDGNWSPWTGWSTCTTTCGPGITDRTRTCTNPSPDSCGKTCDGRGNERKWCFNNPCQPSPAPLRGCVDGNWGTWERWSSCSATCGQGVKERRRRCNRPAPNSCGQKCPGPEFDTTICQGLAACPSERCIDGGYSSWVAWGSCSATCGRGQKSLVRSCDNPAPNRCGKPCDGPDEKVEACQDRPCGVVNDGPTWVTWGSWSPCSCRRATRMRERQCVMRSNRNVLDARRCQGNAKEEEKCDVRGNCPLCIESCGQRADDTYPSCAGCNQYIQCVSGREDRQTCRSGEEWEATLKRCVRAPSPTCSIADCVDDCRNKPNGRYQSCGRCNAYVQCSNGRLSIQQCSRLTDEFNQHTGRCESGRSPTCPRFNLAPFTSGRTHRRRWRMNDAPVVDSDEADASRQANKIPEMLVKVQVKKPKTEGVAGCITDCDGLPSGRYPSCNGCKYFVVCTPNGDLRERICHKKKHWDDKWKRCTHRSSTCRGK